MKALWIVAIVVACILGCYIYAFVPNYRDMKKYIKGFFKMENE